MPQTDNAKLGQEWIRSRVLDTGLCTGCGACVQLCPYQRRHKDQTVVLHACDRLDGRCRLYCPRAPADFSRLRAALFEPGCLTDELGPVKGLYVTRAADPAIREKAQHGGTVSALLKLALEAGLIDRALVAGEQSNLLSLPTAAGSAQEALAGAKSKFVVSSTVAKFNEISQQGGQGIGAVATGCQALALAKMRANPWPGDEERVGRLKLVIGLFCGWTLDWHKISALLSEKVGRATILGMDVPPSGHACMEVYTDQGVVEIPIDEVNPCVREACRYCFDMTAEFADLSVGGSRSPAGWETDKGWNQVIVRSAAGQELLDLAREKGALEFRETPPGNLAKLKKASAAKKKACLASLCELTGSEEDLVYLDCRDRVVCAIREK